MQRDLVVAAGHEVNARVLHDALREWGVANMRRFPWRETHDPYRILMAEVMLHRTQARQVVPIYEQFITRYPNVVVLAQSSPGDLHRILFSLGLRWRIDLMQSMARELMARYSGCVPRAKSELETLPGVSDYIASAVRCFAWNEAEPLIDTRACLTNHDSSQMTMEAITTIAR